MGFASNLRAIRQALGLTQREAAERAGVPLKTYQNWEGSQREPNINSLKRLAKAFQVTIDHLVRDEE